MQNEKALFHGDYKYHEMQSSTTCWSEKSILWLIRSYTFCIVRTKLSQLSIWEETLKKENTNLTLFTFDQSYNGRTLRFGFIFIWSVSTLNGFTSHLLLYLWLDYKYPTKRVPRLLQFPRYYTAAGACWINLFRVVIPFKQIQTRNQFPFHQSKSTTTRETYVTPRRTIFRV